MDLVIKENILRDRGLPMFAKLYISIKEQMPDADNNEMADILGIKLASLERNINRLRISHPSVFESQQTSVKTGVPTSVKTGVPTSVKTGVPTTKGKLTTKEIEIIENCVLTIFRNDNGEPFKSPREFLGGYATLDGLLRDNDVMFQFEINGLKEETIEEWWKMEM